MEYNSDSGNVNYKEDSDDLTPPLGRGTTTGGRVDDVEYSSSCSIDSSRESSVYRQRSINKANNVKKIKKRTDHGKRAEQ